MFIVPKDTELLIFNLPHGLSYPEGKAGMKRLEQELTKRTGVKCVVVDDLLNLGESDFEVRWKSADEPRKEANKPGVIPLNYVDISLLANEMKEDRIKEGKRERRERLKEFILSLLFAVGIMTCAEVLFALIYVYLSNPG